MINKFITVENVSFKYSDDENCKNALDNVSLDIKKGEFLTILGHNASGKSTLARHLNALLLPYSGDVFVNGINTKIEDKIYDIHKTVGLVLQNPDNQIVTSIVEEDVAFGPENLGLMPDIIRQRVDESLRYVDMYDYKNYDTYKLSGGQKQLIAIAGIIAMQPECIVLDEPTAMLDPVGRKEVLNILIKLNREKGITVVLITHYMDEAVFSDRVAVMDKGSILMAGTPKEVFSQVVCLRKHGLDIPKPTELIYNLTQQGYNLPHDVLTINDCVLALEQLLEDNKCR